MQNAATPAAANHPHVGIDERSNPPITVEEADAPAVLPVLVPPPVPLPLPAPLELITCWPCGVTPGWTVNENEPDGMPPTAHDSFHAPTSAVRAVPANWNAPFESVVPIGVVLPPDVAVTCLFGEAPEIETSHVSPT